MKHRCFLCGKIFFSSDPFALYCAECEYEMKRVRLEDEETLEEWMNRVSQPKHSEPRRRGKSLLIFINEP